MTTSTEDPGNQWTSLDSLDRPLLAEAPVLVAGAGPVGLITAYLLAKRGIHTILIERNHETTRWPKMDITNARSMELLKHIGLADELWDLGVDDEFSLDCLFSSGLSEGGELIAKWHLPSPSGMQKQIRQNNNGSMPSQPWLRCSQILFEAWLKKIVEKQPLVEPYYGTKFEHLTESENQVKSIVTDVNTGVEYVVISQYVVGCDGAGSRVRKSGGIGLAATPIAKPTLLVHFKSSDLDILHRQGQFWHLFLSKGAVVISQDEKDTWTMHIPLAPGLDQEALNPEEMVYAAIGVSGAPQRFKIDQILVTSVWSANLAVADEYRTRGKRVFLAGDSAHQNIPFGGYGMNTGLGDAYDLGWKLPMFLSGQGGDALLDSYEIERRPVAIRNVAMSGTNAGVHLKYASWVHEEPLRGVGSNTAARKELHERIRDHVVTNDGENKYLWIEMGYRHSTSPIIVADGSVEKEPAWTEREYFPSTWPGARAPHVLLKDHVTAIFDLLGSDYTVVDFTDEGRVAREFSVIAARLEVPLAILHLPEEEHAQRIWERDTVLVRPDQHVSWRGNSSQPPSLSEIEYILLVSSGRQQK